MRLLIEPLLATGLLLAAHNIAFAENNCQPASIQGWKPEWNRANCAEASVQIDPLGAKAGEDDPACATGDQLADAKKVLDEVNKAAAAGGALAGAKIGTAVGGPIGTVVGGIVGVGATASLQAILKNNYHVNKSVCSNICVHLPVKAINVFVQGWASPMPDHPGIALCDMTDPNQPGRCDIPHNGRWTAMTLYSNARDGTTGQVYCSIGKNWSEDQKPTLGLRAMYDLTP